MDAVIFYSNTGQSKSIAEYIAQKIRYPLISIESVKDTCYKNLVLVFPVHCQNIPDTVKAFLKRVNADNLTVIATYGKMCCGNVLYEIQNGYSKNIVAGAYVPTKHSYIENDDVFRDFERLTPIIKKIKNPSTVQIPRIYKNPFADLFPKLRSRLGLKIYRNSYCNQCGACTEHCPLKAIKSGVTNNNCIRCLKCADICPRHALNVKISLPLKLYLSKEKTNKILIYV